MDVTTNGPIRVASIPWQPRPGAFSLAVVCKATYLLAPGTSPLADTLEDPILRDQPFDDDPRRSLARSADLVPFKRHADVILTGSAFAPGGRPVPSLLARLSAADTDKTIAVHGDRLLDRDDQLGEAHPFTRAPLRWERAAGGPGTWNPAGMRLDVPPDIRGAVAVPNLLPPDRQIVRRRDVLPPAGFMPIASWWPGRADKLGPRAAGWDPRRWSELPLPDDVDAAFFNAAPGDQQVREIRADERILLENLHPEHPRLVTNLELIAVSATVDYGGGSVQEVRLRCDTLAIDTDRGTASLVWRGTVRLSHPAHAGRVVVTAERRGSGGVAVVPAKIAMTGSIDPSVVRRAEAMPFVPAVPGSAPVASTAALPRAGEADALPDLARAHKKFGGTAAIDPAMVRASLKMPFAPAASAPVPPPPPPPGSVREPEMPDALPELRRAHQKFGGTAGIDPAALRRTGEELPFVAGASPLAQPSRPAEPADALPGLARAHQKFGGTAGIDLTSFRRTPLPFGQGASTPVASEAPAPPAMIGPLATPEMAQAAPLPEPAVEAAPVVPEPEKPAEPELPLEKYPLERCAAITASVARRKAERRAILEKNELTAEAWAGLETHWAEVIQKDLERGKTGTLRAFDAAYVGRLEEERGPVTVEEYARLVVAAERGIESEVLEALELPRGAILRVKRVWEARTAGDPALGRRVRRAVEALEAA